MSQNPKFDVMCDISCSLSSTYYSGSVDKCLLLLIVPRRGLENSFLGFVTDNYVLA